EGLEGRARLLIGQGLRGPRRGFVLQERIAGGHALCGAVLRGERGRAALGCGSIRRRIVRRGVVRRGIVGCRVRGGRTGALDRGRGRRRRLLGRRRGELFRREGRGDVGRGSER